MKIIVHSYIFTALLFSITVDNSYADEDIPPPLPSIADAQGVVEPLLPPPSLPKKISRSNEVKAERAKPTADKAKKAMEERRKFITKKLKSKKSTKDTPKIKVTDDDVDDNVRKEGDEELRKLFASENKTLKIKKKQSKRRQNTYSLNARDSIQKQYRTDLDNNLLIAASNGDVAGIRVLLDAGVNINAKDTLGRNALMNSLIAGNIDAVYLLLSKGAKVDTVDNNGMSLAHFAADSNNKDLLIDFVDEGLDINTLNNYGKTPLMIAVQVGDLELIQAIIDSGADVNYTNNNGLTALHIAAQHGNIDVVITLLQSGSIPIYKTVDQMNAQDVAIANNHTNIADLLGREINAFNKKITLFNSNKSYIKNKFRGNNVNHITYNKQSIGNHSNIANPYVNDQKNVNNPSTKLAINYAPPTQEEKLKTLWNKRFENWANVDRRFYSLSDQEKITWSKRLARLQNIFPHRFEKINMNGQKVPDIRIKKWNDFDNKMQMQQNRSAQQNTKRLNTLLKRWKDLDNKFYELSIDEKISANNMRVELLRRILGKGKLSSNFIALPENQRQNFRSSMRKWEVFEKEFGDNLSSKKY